MITFPFWLVMTREYIDELYWKLKESYSDSNLNKIAHHLIRLYRDKQLEKLQIIAEIVSGEEPIESKCTEWERCYREYKCGIGPFNDHARRSSSFL